jgi:hypothetical protein
MIMTTNNDVMTIETTSEDNKTEYRTLVGPSFITIIYELEELLSQGWRVSQEVAPNHNFTLYDIELYKNNDTVRRAKDRIEKVIEGIPVWDTNARREQMAKARAKRKENIDARKEESHES